MIGSTNVSGTCCKPCINFKVRMDPRAYPLGLTRKSENAHLTKEDILAHRVVLRRLELLLYKQTDDLKQIKSQSTDSRCALRHPC